MNGVNDRRRELLRSRVRLFAFLSKCVFDWQDAHLLFPAAVSIARFVGAVPCQVGTPPAAKWSTIISSDYSFAACGVAGQGQA